MIKKLIGLILILAIFFFAIKALVFLPYFTNFVLGSNNQSPFQLGTDYVNQINKVYPNTNQQIRYNQITTDNRYVSRVTLEKVSGKLILTIEGSNTNIPLNIWLTNNPQITNQTEYIDFGLLKNNSSIMQYIVDMKGGDISFDNYKYVLLVDKDYKIYKTIILN